MTSIPLTDEDRLSKVHDAQLVEEEEEEYDEVPDVPISYEEEKRLGSYKPLRTILALCIGPMVSQMVNAFYGLINSLWVARTLGAKGMSVFGAVYVVEFIAVSISQYICQSLSVRVAFLFGQQRKQECDQLYVDFIRVAVVLGMIVPCVVLPITKPLIKWFGADQELADMCLTYMWPVTAACFLNFLYMMGCGLLQAEGRSILFGIVQTISFVTNMCLCPIFLILLKTPIWGASTATILSEGIPGIVLMILVFFGKFSLHPKVAMFVKPFSTETWSALRVGFSTFISSISMTLPVLLMQKYFNSCATAIGIYPVAIQVWAVVEKLYQITGGACVAFSQALTPAASYAYGSGRLNRVLKLGIHALWLATASSFVFSIFMMALPRQIASIWSSDPDFLDWAEKMVPITFYTSFCFAVQYIAPSLLQAMKQVVASTTLSILTLLLPLPVFSTILYFTDKKNPTRIFYTYTLNDIYSFLVSAVFVIKPLKILWTAEESGICEGKGQKLQDIATLGDYEEDGEEAENAANTPNTKPQP